MNFSQPLPPNELERLLSLSEYDLDYTNLQENFKDLTRLAAKVAGAEISLVNLLDSFTQWTISSHGMLFDNLPREKTVCQYTIMEEDYMEVRNLAGDERFLDYDFVKGDSKLLYYLGIPLQNQEGYNLGALCIMDKYPRTIDPEKIEMLKIIADEVVNRLNTLKVIEGLKSQVKEEREAKLKVAHDIRGPLNGIISLAKLVSEQGESSNLQDVLKFIGLIHKSGTSILDLADEILNTESRLRDKTLDLRDNELNLVAFKEKLERLYGSQTIAKNIRFLIDIPQRAKKVPFLKNKLLQVTGNLISNAIKFTPPSGFVTVKLDLSTEEQLNTLHISVADSGVGMSPQAIEAILEGRQASTNGTSGENGYGFGLSLVRHLVSSMKGTFEITSKEGEGTTFYISLPQPKLQPA